MGASSLGHLGGRDKRCRVKAVRLWESAKSHLNALVLRIVETASKNSRGCAASSVIAKARGAKGRKCDPSDVNGNAGTNEGCCDDTMARKKLRILLSWDGDLSQRGGSGEAHHGVEDIAWS